jgi:hypothetical protein
MENTHSAQISHRNGLHALGGGTCPVKEKSIGVGSIPCFIGAGKKQTKREATYAHASDQGQHPVKPRRVRSYAHGWLGLKGKKERGPEELKAVSVQASIGFVNREIPHHPGMADSTHT